MGDIHTMPIPEFLDNHTMEPDNIISLRKAPSGGIPSDADGAIPADLFGAFPVPPLPSGLLPNCIEQFARVTAVQMGADPAGLAMSALVACAAAIPDSVHLQVKQHDPHWCVSARIWVLLIGQPSTKKSPTIKSATRPLYPLDRAAFEEWQLALAAYNAIPKDNRIGQPPLPKRLIIEDTTMEAAQQVLLGSPEGITLLNDEMSGFFGAMEKYSGKGAAADRAFWLKSFDGGPYMINRIGRTGAAGAIIPNISVNMLGGIQPDAIKAVAASAADDGLIQRFFPVILKSAEIGHDRPGLDVATQHADLINSLNRLAMIPPLQFDEDARQIRLEEESKNHRLQLFEEINTKLASHIGKYDGMFARLCLIWHCIEHATAEELPSVISGETAQRVAQFFKYFLFPHALSFYAHMLDEGSNQHKLIEVAKHILAHQLDMVNNAELQSRVHATRNMSKRERLALLETLEGLGWIFELPPKGLKRSERWKVNPNVHGLFENHATEARNRKKQLREIMEEDFAFRRNPTD